MFGLFEDGFDCECEDYKNQVMIFGNGKACCKHAYGVLTWLGHNRLSDYVLAAGQPDFNNNEVWGWWVVDRRPTTSNQINLRRKKNNNNNKNTKKTWYKTRKTWYNKKRTKGKKQTARKGERHDLADQQPSKRRNTKTPQKPQTEHRSQGRKPDGQGNGKNSRGKPPRRGKPHARTAQPKPDPTTNEQEKAENTLSLLSLFSLSLPLLVSQHPRLLKSTATHVKRRQINHRA